MRGIMIETDYRYDQHFRDYVARRCAAFAPIAVGAQSEALKPAAVAITIVPMKDRAALLLTRRAEDLRSHGGQWALPGGRCDPGEAPVTAALRELEEELGLALTDEDVLGVLDDYPTRSGYLIKPVVLWCRGEPRLHLNPQEVASAHRIPLAEAARKEALSFISIPESDRRVIRIQIEGCFVHAPTAAIIYQFLEVLAGRDTRVFDLEQPVFAWR